jgi:hypothetical protein
VGAPARNRSSAAIGFCHGGNNARKSGNANALQCRPFRTVRYLRTGISDRRVEGRLTPLPQGGDLRSHHIEAYRDVILGAIDTELDITLVELSDLLRREHKASFAPSTVWRFLERRCGRGAGPPRRCVPTWRPARQPQRWGERAPGADEPIHPSALVALQSASWQPARHGSAAPGGRCSFAC